MPQTIKHDDTLSFAEKEKDNSWIYLLIFILVAVAIGAFVWYFGFRANQGEIIYENEPIIIQQIVP
ncbi:hypothetical protein L6259_03580 [Candidatus Parcubacteria bacterium]|nr:hypothetical protein [Patescibacteria group bacterium]MCG2694316.1 hypothetical protein [Candidatus Parcubacteria bacterium]